MLTNDDIRLKVNNYLKLDTDYVGETKSRSLLRNAAGYRGI